MVQSTVKACIHENDIDPIGHRSDSSRLDTYLYLRWRGHSKNCQHYSSGNLCPVQYQWERISNTLVICRCREGSECDESRQADDYP